jgi:selenocysteine lyase/cysteine desulfurase
VGAIQKHNHALLDMLIDYIDATPVYRITSSLAKKHRSSILSFTSDAIDIAEVHRSLAGKRIVTGLREGSIRVSAHLYNNRREMLALIQALDLMAGRVRTR